jgi:adenylate cyclase
VQLAEFLEDYGRFLHELFASSIGSAATYVNTWGDAIYAVFDNVTDTAAFALELIEPTVAKTPDWSKYEMGESSPFRVGVHSGPVFELQDTFQGRSAFSGQHVSRAARIEPATMRGCVYASEPFAALLTMEGNQQFHIESAGVHRLAKDYDRCQLYRIERKVSTIKS